MSKATNQKPHIIFVTIIADFFTFNGFRKSRFSTGSNWDTEDLKHVLKPWMSGLSNHVGYNTIGPLLEVVISLQRHKHGIFLSYFRRFLNFQWVLGPKILLKLVYTSHEWFHQTTIFQHQLQKQKFQINQIR
jgi:hypothetical protein